MIRQKVLIFSFLFVIIVIISCKNSDTKIKADDSIDNKENFIKRSDTTNPDMIFAKKITRWDSLQGNWQSDKDLKSFLQIKNENYINNYDNEITDTSIFCLADSCSSAFNQKNKKGEFLIALDDEQYQMCYQIDFLSADKLILFYEGKTLVFNRK